jgi:cellulose synthase/poly-beta-1,6-N-acetylglucosamine synthase-like glycosyltransferase
MNWVFFISLALIAYTYLGYPLLLLLRSKFRSPPVRRGPIEPSVSVVIAMHNEANAVRQKLQNLAELEYSRELLQIIVVSDDSTDGTYELLANSPVPVERICLPTRQGKAVALNHGVQRAEGEIVVFMDARQRILPSALRSLVSGFADPCVGAVSGELVLEDPQKPDRGYELNLYWKIEKLVRKLESDTHSAVGATGALYAVRRQLIPPLPPATILDDLFIPMSVVKQGYRVAFEEEAVVVDRIFPEVKTEFRRKVRTLMGNYQLLRLAPWLLTFENRLLWEFASHKLLRLVVPFALLGAFISNWRMANSGVGRVMFAVQVAFYLLALLGLARPVRSSIRASGIAFSFALLNTAAVVGLLKFLAGKKDVWAR